MSHKTPNYYEILGVLQNSTEKEILKAYRRKALVCHPDKNPDNPKAVELFHEISEALKILTDSEARTALDKILIAKEKALLRNQALDVKRKKFKEDLEKRETAAQNEKESDIDATERLAAEIKRLREEGSRLVKEQQELVQKQLDEELKSQKSEEITPKLKVKWKAGKKDHENGGYNEHVLINIFQKFGELIAILVSTKKKGLAVVEYKSSLHANMAIEFAKGNEKNPLTISWLEAPSRTTPAFIFVPKTCENESEDSVDHQQNDDFEAMVLTKMRRAEERKRIAKQIEEEEK